jgi:hypothetical protein
MWNATPHWGDVWAVRYGLEKWLLQIQVAPRAKLANIGQHSRVAMTGGRVRARGCRGPLDTLTLSLPIDLLY